MPLDAICVRALASDLNNSMSGFRVDKVTQPEKDEIVLHLHGNGQTRRLLLSANTNTARVQFVQEARENPEKPPMFCMLLRKHLIGGRFTIASTPEYPERIISITFAVIDELGDSTTRTLHCELIGRYSNIILTDNDNRIIDCLRRVDLEMSALRQVLPGLFYRVPPLQDKRDPFTTSVEQFRSLAEAAPGGTRVSSWLLATFNGFSPLICRELAFRACNDTTAVFQSLTPSQRDKLVFAFSELIVMAAARTFSPCMLFDSKTGRPFDFSFMPIRQYGLAYVSQPYDDFHKMLSDFYGRRDADDRLTRRSSELFKVITNANSRIVRKIAAQRQELSATANREQLRELGDIINANLDRIEKGAARAVLPNLYAEDGSTIDIALEPRLSPARNAQKYYKEYAKLKSAEKILASIIEQGEQEQVYLESVLDELARAESYAELDEIAQELLETGYIKRHIPRNKASMKHLPPYAYRSTSGFHIYVGRNNVQNDLLSLKTADRSDLWLHAQKVPGAHVLIDTEGVRPDDHTITEACAIAAWHSKSRGSSNVAVDYTLVRNLKKPAGARPGMVIYHVYETAYVTPDETLIQKLRADAK